MIRWISAHSIARAGPDGKPAEMIGVNRDTTAQKDAEIALRISEERQRLAVEANDVGTWDYDMVTGEHALVGPVPDALRPAARLAGGPRPRARPDRSLPTGRRSATAGKPHPTPPATAASVSSIASSAPTTAPGAGSRSAAASSSTAPIADRCVPSA